MTMFFAGRPPWRSQAMTASTTSRRVAIRPAPTGLTLMPTTSFLLKNNFALLANDLPVRARMPFSNMEATTLPFTPASFMARSSLTATTLPGKSPGSEFFVRGTAMASSMLVLGLAGGAGLAASWPKTGGRPSSSPAPISEPPPIFKKSRRSSVGSKSSERYPFFFIGHLRISEIRVKYSQRPVFFKYWYARWD